MPIKGRKPRKVEFKGRFHVESHQIKTDIAFKLLEKCLKKNNLIKTKLKLIDGGFYLGTHTGIKQIKRKTFMFNSIKRFYVFKTDTKCVIVVNNIKDKSYMSLIKFSNPIELTEILESIEQTRGPSTSNLPNNEHVFDNPVFKVDENDDESDKSEEESEKENDENDFKQEVEVQNEILVNSGINTFDEVDGEKIEDFLRSGNSSRMEESNTLRIPEITYVRSDSKIDNLFSSYYDDLFIEIDYENKNDITVEVHDGSIYMYSQQYSVPVIDLYGFCESEDEDV